MEKGTGNGRQRMRRVTAAEPCPICRKPDWCLAAPDGTAAICPRVESGRRCGDAGWLHRLTDDPHGWLTSPRRVLIPFGTPQADLSALAERYHQALAPDRLAGFARTLGVSPGALSALRVGWSADHLAWTFPMTDPATGRTAGIRLRDPNGSKYAVQGGKDALFLPATAPGPDAALFVTEGPTDAAALLDLGFPNVAGRPSCTGGVRHLLALVRSRRPAGAVIVADGDDRGRAGAEKLAGVLGLHVPAVRVVTPPAGVKDARAWRQAGATRADFEELVRAASIRRPIVTTTIRGNR